MTLPPIEVYKFGGASLKDAAGFRNVSKLLKNAAPARLLLVVSALGKTTNALEKLTQAFFTGDDTLVNEAFGQVKAVHTAILNELFSPGHAVYDELSNSYTEIEWILEDEPHTAYDFIYDQIVSTGEILSSKMLHAWLLQEGIKSIWADARDFIITDNSYREAQVDLKSSLQNTRTTLLPLLRDSWVITQGFVGGTTENYSSTLGREGSDYSAAIFADLLDAASLTVWKDVPGIMNADPAVYAAAQVLPELSYTEATELAFYGATVIHPKTMKPLQSKNIPLFVRSFLDTGLQGTQVSLKAGIPSVPSYIFKKDQLLISLQTPDFSFILEDHLSQLFRIFSDCRVRINMMENSALSFSAVVDEDRNGAKNSRLLEELAHFYTLKYNTGLTLLTVRNYHKDIVTAYSFLTGYELLMESKTRNNIQFLYR